MDWISIITAIGSLATAGGMIATAWQVRIIKRQTGIQAGQLELQSQQIKLQTDQLNLQTTLAQNQFEDEMTRQYRDIIHKVPVKALLGKELDTSELECCLTIFYHYFDLCNEQAFLYRTNRISEDTWQTWLEGMQSHGSRPAFKQAWAEIVSHQQSIEFEELANAVPELSRQQLNLSPQYKLAVVTVTEQQVQLNTSL